MSKEIKDHPSDLKKIDYPIPANTYAVTGEEIKRNASGIPVDAYATSRDAALAGAVFSAEKSDDNVSSDIDVAPVMIERFGEKTAMLLFSNGFETIEAVAVAEEAELKAINGIGTGAVRNIREALKS